MYSTIVVVGGGLAKFDGAESWIKYAVWTQMPAQFRLALETMDVICSPKVRAAHLASLSTRNLSSFVEFPLSFVVATQRCRHSSSIDQALNFPHFCSLRISSPLPCCFWVSWTLNVFRFFSGDRPTGGELERRRHSQLFRHCPRTVDPPERVEQTWGQNTAREGAFRVVTSVFSQCSHS